MKFASLPWPASLLLGLFVLGVVGTSRGETGPALGSTVFRFDELKVQPTPVGERRDVARQPTATLHEFECHLSMLNKGCSSHPPHRHPQEELIVLTEGTLEVFINGKVHEVGPGSLFFFASYDLHNVRNVGAGPAKYGVFNFATAATATIPAVPAAELPAARRLDSAVFAWTNLPVTTTPTGERRTVLDGATVTCRNLECHVTTLAPGKAAHAPHRHPDEEVIFVKDGEVDVRINEATRRATAGSVIFFAGNDEHGITNAGSGPATYYVIRVVTEKTAAVSKL